MTSKEKNTKRLIELLRTVEEHKNILKKMFFGTFPDNSVAKKIYDEILDKMDAKELYEKYAEIYRSVFTDKEIKQLLVFYDSPIGRKATGNALYIATKSIEVGKEWIGNYLAKEEDNIRMKIEKIIMDEANSEDVKSLAKMNDDKIPIEKIGDITMPQAKIDKLQDIKITEARYNFAQGYAKTKGWVIDNLSLEQVMEIRTQEGWINPKI